MKNKLLQLLFLIMFLVVGIHADPIDDLIKKAVKLRDQSDFIGALDVYDQIILSDPTNLFAWDQKGGILLDQGRINEAIAIWNKCDALRTPNKAWLLVKSIPEGGTVIIDGTNEQITPYCYMNVDLGYHDVTVNVPGYYPSTSSAKVVECGSTFVFSELIPIPENEDKNAKGGFSGPIPEDSTLINQYQEKEIVMTPVISSLQTSEPMEIATEFSFFQTTGTQPMLVSFMDQSTGNPTTWLWDFGDGTSDITQNPTHLYTSPGAYEVTLTVSNGNAIGTPTKKQVTIFGTTTSSSSVLGEQDNSEFQTAPDLNIAISSLSYDQKTSDISFNLMIENKGNASAGKFYSSYSLTMGDPENEYRTFAYFIGRDTVNGLDPGEKRESRSTKVFNIDKTLIKSGTYWFLADINPIDEIIDSYEENNSIYWEEPIIIE